MQNALYMDDSYLKEFEATVESVKDDKFVVLDKSAFYPSGGGQPHDTGVMVCNGEEYPVVYVGKFSGKISHEVSKPGLKPGDKVQGKIDWERRYKFMRMHTASHVLTSVFNKQDGVLITGNQIDLEKTRIDYNMVDFDREKMLDYINQANEIIKKNIEIKTYYLSKEEAMKIPGVVKLAGALPPDVKQLRIVEIPDVDLQADGGTHVKQLSEIGTIEFIKAENKGKERRRVYYTLK
ncbi:alanyl-tRNA editing protein AlaX [Candidatus Woesearchaeota archaeon]|jgi:misacylated tRNA(Ala) deacylase|nr:alanyl-tRNA editing protein AlaX [Candidatus Woesearchaeota archaeon]MDP6648336.1 alanyl-tRNA editing protein AlaXM [Candidatus Woesearchaeota archaeon]|tara:strand:+ start:368 stop:1075 length:708 start_codon:yes stop_codon:yes gene_type:complete